ncbi:MULTISPECIES: TetR/AcrR family transcriptional regulator [unclassified Variovorax]|uniref:TetR/AcrR family transcriptional regulator n=1 Tax=unclassified Variovorax TaxID=663243 RepID=UPI001BD638C5|nr:MULTISPECIES: TetR/AcrR family transcriptional regulator [unclassified Variovorax]
MQRAPRNSSSPAAAATAPVEAGESARRLLETAERLFAEEGVDGVALSRIVSMSGHRNASALHYHFGSRQAIVSNVLNMRLDHINGLRNVMLDKIEREGRGGNGRDVFEAVVLPLQQTIASTAWGADYVQVLAQSVLNPRIMRSDLIDRGKLTGFLRVRKLLHAALPGVPPPVLDDRFVWANENVILGLARWSRADAADRMLVDVAQDLVDFAVGGLGAPVSRVIPVRSRVKAIQGLDHFFR